MAKKPEIQVQVQSSAFKELLTTQKDSLQTMKSMEELLKQTRLIELGALAEEIKILKDNDAELKVASETKKVQDKQLKELEKISAGSENKDKDEEAKAIENIAKSMKTFKTLGEKFEEFGNKIKQNLSAENLLQKVNIGGIFSKTLERNKFIKQQRALGSEKSVDELKQDFKGAHTSAKALGKTQKEIEDYKKLTGLSDDDLNKTKEGKRLLEQKSDQAKEYSKYDLRPAIVTNKPDVTALNASKSPTAMFADSGEQEEQSNENNKLIGEQTTLLTKIEENTRGDSPAQKIKPKENTEGGGKGMLSGLLGGGKVGKALDGMKNFGIGLIAVAGALWIASKAFASFAEVEWESVTKGIVALGALVVAAKVLDSMKGSLVKSAGVLGLMALSLWGISAAFGEFAELDWDTVLKGIAAVAALGVVGVVLGKFAGAAVKGGIALAALGAGMWVLGKGMQEMGEAFNEFVNGIEKLSNIGFEGLAGVAGGMVLVGGALAAFAAGQIAAGLGTLVSNLLTLGQDSPIEQLEKLGNLGPKLVQAAEGINGIGKAMKAFAGIDKKQMDAINDFPWIRATAFVAAGGSMTVNGATVTAASKQNADEAATAGKSGGGGTAIVNAPVTTNNNTSQIIKSPIRNQESSMSKFVASRFSRA